MKFKNFFFFTVLSFLILTEINSEKSHVSAQEYSILQGEYLAGERVYQTYCAVCHGRELKGDGVASSTMIPAPSDLTIPRRHDRWEIVLEGKENTAMSGYEDRLTAEQLDNLRIFLERNQR